MYTPALCAVFVVGKVLDRAQNQDEFSLVVAIQNKNHISICKMIDSFTKLSASNINEVVKEH